MVYLLFIPFIVIWLIAFGISCNVMPKPTGKNIAIAFIVATLAIPSGFLDIIGFLCMRLSRYIEDFADFVTAKEDA